MTNELNQFWRFSVRSLLVLAAVYGPLLGVLGIGWRHGGYGWEFPVFFLFGCLIFIAPLALYVAIRIVVYRLTHRNIASEATEAEN